MIRTDKLVIIVVLTLFFVIGLYRIFFVERWQNYERKPFGRVSTGSNPLGFYKRNAYRKPYRYPLRYEKTAQIRNSAYLI